MRGYVKWKVIWILQFHKCWLLFLRTKPQTCAHCEFFSHFRRVLSIHTGPPHGKLKIEVVSWYWFSSEAVYLDGWHILKPCSLEPIKATEIGLTFGGGGGGERGRSAHGMPSCAVESRAQGSGMWAQVYSGRRTSEIFLQRFTAFENHFSSLRKKFQMLPVEYRRYLSSEWPPSVHWPPEYLQLFLTQWKHLFICLAVPKTDFRSPPWKGIWVIKNRAVARPALKRMISLCEADTS